MHPNFQGDEITRKSLMTVEKSKTKGCVKALKYLDGVVLKPMFLYNYDPFGHKRIREFQETFLYKGE